MLDFPASPTLNQKYPQPAIAGKPLYTWDGEKWTGLAQAYVGPVLRGYIAGLTLSTLGSSATFSVVSGAATDSIYKDVMVLPGTISKTTAAWALGTGVGGLDTGTIAANTWYHVYLIKRPDTGVVDVTFSLSASAPALPTNYTLYRRIGSLLTNASSQWQLFTQRGDSFDWSNMLMSTNVTNPGTAAFNITVFTPPGIVCEAKLFTGFLASSAATDQVISWYLAEVGTTTDTVPNVSTVATHSAYVASATGVEAMGSVKHVFTNTLQQVRCRIQQSAAGTTFYCKTLGWIDNRGKDI
jgi:hypothetical protein